MKNKILFTILLIFIFPLVVYGIDEVQLEKPEFNIKNNTYISLRLEIDYNDEDVTGYQIYRATSKNGSYKRIKTIKTDNYEIGDTIKYIDGSKKFNKTYYYKIRSYYKDTDGTVKYSKYSTVKSKKVLVQAPTVTGNRVTFLKNKLTWKKVKGATGYAVYKLVNGKYVYQKSTTSLSYTDTFKNSKTKLDLSAKYKVRAYRKVNGKKIYGPYSQVITIKSELTTPKLNYTSIDHTSYKLTNKSSIAGATGYELYSCSDVNCTDLELENLSENINTKSMAEQQYFIIRAVREVNGNIMYSDYSNVYTFSATPLILDVKDSNLFNAYILDRNSVRFEINNDDSTTEFEIQRSNSKSGTYNLNNSIDCKNKKEYLIDEYVESYRAIGENVTNEQINRLENYYNTNYPDYNTSYYCTDTSLEVGKSYYYKIRTVKEENGIKYYSDYSDVIEFKIKPAKVTGIGTTPYKYNSTTIYWDEVETGADGYEVYRATSKSGSYKKIATTKNNYYKNSGTVGKKYYYKVRAYLLDKNGKKIYGTFSAITSRTIKSLTSLNSYPIQVKDYYTTVNIKSVTTSISKTSTNSIRYTFKFNYNKTVSTAKRKMTYRVYFYDYNFNLISIVNFPAVIKKGTNKNYYSSFTVDLSKDIVYFEIV